MKFEDLKSNFITLNEAIDIIKLNESNSYIWYPVKNKKKCLLEIGGKNVNNLELKVNIPSIKEDKYITYGNSYIKLEYSISLDGKIEFPTFNSFHNLSKKDFIYFINNTNFKKYYPKIKETEYTEVYRSKEVKL